MGLAIVIMAGITVIVVIICITALLFNESDLLNIRETDERLSRLEKRMTTIELAISKFIDKQV